MESTIAYIMEVDDDDIDEVTSVLDIAIIEAKYEYEGDIDQSDVLCVELTFINFDLT